MWRWLVVVVGCSNSPGDVPDPTAALSASTVAIEVLDALDARTVVHGITPRATR
jgi:hypothetical protein